MYQSKINTIQVNIQPSLVYHTLNHSKVFKIQVFTLNYLSVSIYHMLACLPILLYLDYTIAQIKRSLFMVVMGLQGK